MIKPRHILEAAFWVGAIPVLCATVAVCESIGKVTRYAQRVKRERALRRLAAKYGHTWGYVQQVYECRAGCDLERTENCLQLDAEAGVLRVM